MARHPRTAPRPLTRLPGIFLGIVALFAAHGCQQRPLSSTELVAVTGERIRRLDPTVREVKIRTDIRSGADSGCGPIPEGNLVAFYCPSDRTVYVTTKTADHIQSSFGPLGIQYVVAHELGHARQHAVTGFASDIVWSVVLDELQADCIAGAHLRQLEGITPESEQGGRVIDFARQIGDYAILQREWHGTPALRARALRRGLNQGDVARCLSSARFNYDQLLEKGQGILERVRQAGS